jgi:hypothetical protein
LILSLDSLHQKICSDNQVQKLVYGYIGFRDFEIPDKQHVEGAVGLDLKSFKKAI